MSPLVDAYIALGANLGEPEAQLLSALGALAALPGTRLVRSSALYRGRAVGYAAQPDFVNAVAWLKTRLAPRALLDHCLELETRHGRRRTFRNAPRTLDLDLLLYNGLVMDEPGLTLPHPRLHERAFVLLPLVEIAPRCPVPGRGTALELLARVDAGDLTRLPDPADRALPAVRGR